MKTRSTEISSRFTPGFRPIYSSARSVALRSESLFASCGLGTRAVTGAAMPGLVPQVTKGASLAASISTVVSNLAPESVGRLRQ